VALLPGQIVNVSLLTTVLQHISTSAHQHIFLGMNFIDVLILIPAVWGFWRGFMKGVVMEVATLLAFFLGVWGGMKLSDVVAGWIRDLFSSESAYIPLIAFALVFVSILIGVFAIAKFIEKSMEETTLGIFNKLAGGLFGCLKFLLIISVIFFVIDAVEKSVTVIPPHVKNNSLLYRPVAQIAPAVIPGLRDSDLGKMIPEKDDVEVDVEVNVKLDTAADTVQ
jgi:membrane protein required for colicin V production